MEPGRRMGFLTTRCAATKLALVMTELDVDPKKDRIIAPKDSEFLQINEIFYSIQGETSLAGWPTVFVRTMGCNIRCTYCDTKYSYYEGQRKSFAEIQKTIKSHNVRHICVTGGEPMAQPRVIPFMKSLCDQGYIVSLETNGYFDTKDVDPRVIKIIDIKTPDSGEGES